MSIPQSSTEQSGGSFFSSTPERVFTVSLFDADEQLMIQQAEQFSRKEVLPIQERLEKQEQGLMKGLIQKAGQLGFCGVDTPDRFGGLGLGKGLAARILEFLSLDASFSVTLGVTSGIAQIGLVLFGNDDQRDAYLPRLASGEWIGAYALSEPNSGSDALSATTRAEKRGDHWILNGTKMWISNAAWAELFLVMAKIDGEHFSAFLVERDFPGVAISREEHKMGLKGSSTARLVLENAEVPLENLMHEPGMGHQVAFNALNIGRFKLGAMCLGSAREAIGISSVYAQDRQQFGKPISSFGLIQQKFAQMATRYFVAESVLYRTGALVDSAFAAHFDGSPGGARKAAEEFAIECSATKVICSEAQAFIVDDALQCYGGYGFTEEFPIARIYRDARVARIYEGTNEINRVFMADRLVRRAKEGRASLASAGDSFVSELAGKGMAREASNQCVQGAQSDLVMLAYAEQTARLRADQEGGLSKALYESALGWINSAAATAYQTITGESVLLPGPIGKDQESLAEAVYRAKGPL